MILFISDAQGRFDVINAQIDHAEQHSGRAVDAVLLSGDLGLYEPQLSQFFRKREQRFRRPFYFVEGNHEDFDCFEKYVQRYADVMTHLRRGAATTIAGRTVLSLGGASYMDSHTTPEQSLIHPRDIQACLAHPPERAEIIITHDCPRGIGVSCSPKYRHLGVPGFAGSRELLDRFHPRIWVFGHHHRWFQATIDGTRFYGLPEAWRGYALLHADDQVQCVENIIPQPASWWQSAARRWTRLWSGRP